MLSSRNRIVAVMALASLINTPLFAQPCDHFLYLQNGKTIEMTVYNKKGKATGVNTYRVSEVNSSGARRTGKVEMVMANDKGKETATATTRVTCSGGTYSVDMTGLIPAAQLEQMKNVEATGEFYLDYPANMKVGDNLPDGELNFETSSNGIKTNLELNVSNRRVEGKETVTSPAGTWECFKITSNMRMRMRLGGIGIPVNSETTEWYAPGVGIVQSESKHGKTLITAIR